MANKLTELAVRDEVLVSKIYTIRGERVMMDSDLAELYGVETRRLNEQVKRNSDRFPEDFMFQVTEAEFLILKSQNATSSWGGRRKLPYAFTEHGVLMLSSVLNSEQATKVNIQIMRVYTKIRNILASNKDLLMKFDQLQTKFIDHDNKIMLLLKYFKQLERMKQQEVLQQNRRRIGYKKEGIL